MRGAAVRQRTAWATTGSSRPFSCSGPSSSSGTLEPAAGEHAHDVRDEDLAARRRVAEPAGDDHRRAEEVAVLVDRLAGVDADAQLEAGQTGRSRQSASRRRTATASRALEKATMSPSPRFLTSRPWWAVIALRSTEKCARRSSSAASSPSVESSAVEPTMSVKRIVRTSDACVHEPILDRGGRYPWSRSTSRTVPGVALGLEQRDQLEPAIEAGVAGSEPRWMTPEMGSAAGSISIHSRSVAGSLLIARSCRPPAVRGDGERPCSFPAGSNVSPALYERPPASMAT